MWRAVVKGEGNLVIVAFSVESVRRHSRLPYFFYFLFLFKQRNKIFIISTSFGVRVRGAWECKRSGAQLNRTENDRSIKDAAKAYPDSTQL